jgi:hypothetical protein
MWIEVNRDVEHRCDDPVPDGTTARMKQHDGCGIIRSDLGSTLLFERNTDVYHE